MKNRTLYVYRDQPGSIFQIEKLFKMNLKLKKYNLKFISTEKLNYSKQSIVKYFQNTPKKEIPKKMIKFKNLQEFETFVKKLKKDDLVLVANRTTTKNKYNSFDLNLFKKYKIHTIFLSEYPWIRCNFKKSIFVNLIRLMNKFLQKIKILFRNNINYKPDFYIGSGEIARKNFIKNQNARNYINLPSLWIDFSKKKKKKGIITYVDENVFLSRDLKLLDENKKKCSNPKKFLKDLNNFFYLLEAKTKLKVVIACSSKFKKYKNNIFNGRNVFYGKTLDLISNSSLVIGHSSEALLQAIYNKVPVQCIKHKTFNFMRNFLIESKSVKLFNKNSLFIEDYLERTNEIDLSIDKKFYKNILNDYFITKNLNYENFSKKFKSEIDKLN